MRIRNDTGHPIQLRLDDNHDSYIWKIIEPGEEAYVNIPADYADRMGLTPISMENEPVVAVLKPVVATIGATQIETKIVEEPFIKEDPDPAFVSELKKTRGLGKETIKNILGVFPNKVRLQQAIKAGIELPFNDKVDSILRGKYG